MQHKHSLRPSTLPARRCGHAQTFPWTSVRIKDRVKVPASFREPYSKTVADIILDLFVLKPDAPFEVATIWPWINEMEQKMLRNQSYQSFRNCRETPGVVFQGAATKNIRIWIRKPISSTSCHVHPKPSSWCWRSDLVTQSLISYTLMANHLHAIPDGSRRSGTLLDDIRYESDGVLRYHI